MKTYEIQNDKLSVKLSTRGGTLTSICRDGLEYLWQGDARYWPRQAPVCFPICGSLRNGAAKTLDGRELRMIRHGVAKDREFEMEESDSEHVVFILEDNAETLAEYPYHFALRAGYRLAGSGIDVTFSVQNRDTAPMPFCLGGHPGFNVPLCAGERFEDYYLEFEAAETLYVPFQEAGSGLVDNDRRRELMRGARILPLSHTLFENDCLQLEGLRSRAVSLRSKKGSKSVRVDFPDFPMLLIWSGKGAPFVCIEPWLGTTTALQEDDIFEHKRFVQRLLPGEAKSYRFSITVD